MVIAMDIAELRRLNRASRDELRNEIAERDAQLEADPQVAHDAMMAQLEVTRSTPPVVFKTHDNGSSVYAAAEPSPLNNDELIDTIAETLAEEGDEIRREFEARIAVLEGQVSTLLSLLGADPSRAKSIRKSLRNDTQLLEGPSTRHNA
jgi:hypothetical protein